MKNNDAYILIRCTDCVQDTCSLLCDKTALAYAHGDIIINMEKCGDCSFAKRNGIPDCVESCDNAGEKAVLTITDVEEKRVGAIGAMSFL